MSERRREAKSQKKKKKTRLSTRAKPPRPASSAPPAATAHCSRKKKNSSPFAPSFRFVFQPLLSLSFSLHLSSRSHPFIPPEYILSSLSICPTTIPTFSSTLASLSPSMSNRTRKQAKKAAAEPLSELEKAIRAIDFATESANAAKERKPCYCLGNRKNINGTQTSQIVRPSSKNMMLTP